MSFVKRLVASTFRRSLSKFDKVYQRHVGEECYIFGHGTSLKWMDLYQFGDKPSILAPCSLYHQDAKALKAPYCAFTETFVFYPFFPWRENGKFKLLRHYLHIEFSKSIKENPETLFFLNISNYPTARFSNVIFVDRRYIPPFAVQNPFKDRIDSHEGTFKFQVSLAIFMGFKKAYLIGHDQTHYPMRGSHFFEKGEGTLHWNQHMKHTHHRRLEFINYAKQHIDLVTITLDEGSKVMGFITYKNMTGKDPHYRENTEIIERVKLENLATWHAYSIF